MFGRCGQLVSRLVRGSAAAGWRRWVSTESKKYVAMWGNGDFGRLGLGDFSSKWKPTVCERLKEENPSAVSCGGAHTLFLTEEGRVFATGMNDFGQLGIPGITDHAPEPCEVAGFGEKVKISAGYRHSAVITVTLECFVSSREKIMKWCADIHHPNFALRREKREIKN